MARSKLLAVMGGRSLTPGAGEGRGARWELAEVVGRRRGHWVGVRRVHVAIHAVVVMQPSLVIALLHRPLGT